MAPKRREKVNDNNVNKSNVFHPDSVPDKDRITLVVTDSDSFFKQFLSAVFFLRNITAYSGSKCRLSRDNSKFRCGEEIDYQNESLFMILHVSLDEKFGIDLLIYKPELYLLATCAQGKWEKVKDFKIHTRLDFDGATDFDFEANYKGSVPPKYNFQILRDCIRTIYRGGQGDIEGCFKKLAVIFCETTRFDLLLYTIVNVMEFRTTTIILSDVQCWVVKNWEALSKLYIFYCLGYVWNPLDLQSLRAETFEEAYEIIGILCYVQDKVILCDLERIYNKMEEEKRMIEEMRKKDQVIVPKKWRRRSIGDEDIELLKNIRNREVQRRMRELESKKSEVEENVMAEYKFLDVMIANMKKERREAP